MDRRIAIIGLTLISFEIGVMLGVIGVIYPKMYAVIDNFFRITTIIFVLTGVVMMVIYLFIEAIHGEEDEIYNQKEG